MSSSGEHLLNYRDAVVYPSDLALLDSRTAWLNDACINFRMTRLSEARRTRKERRAEEERRQKRQKNGVESDDQLEDLFLDPSVVSFLMHQLPEGDEDYDDEISNLNASWNLPQPPTSSSGHKKCGGMKKKILESEQSNSQRSTQYHQRKRVFVPISDQFGASRSAFARPGGGHHWSMLLWEINSLYYEIDDGYCALVGVGFHHFDSSRGCNAPAAIAVAKKLHQVLCSTMSEQDGVADVVDVEECKTPQQRNGHDCGLHALGSAEALCASEDYGFLKEEHEDIVRRHFEENGGHAEFASNLRKRIGDDIRELAQEG
ncbi:hypothetical protein ACHAWF_000836 [Thalassiosira exigua]